MPRLQQQYDRNVFINCPFDDDYIPILHSVTFTVCFAGFIPRSSLETNDSGTVRLEKISKIIENSKYGIHDISRIEAGGSPGDPLPRFNMPFECGLFFGARHFGSGRHKAKELLVLDSVAYQSQKTLSDISGNDPRFHEKDPFKAIACVRNFFSEANGDKRLPGETHIQQVYREFRSDLPDLTKNLSISEEELSRLSYWRDFVTVVNVFLRKKYPPPGGQAD